MAHVCRECGASFKGNSNNNRNLYCSIPCRVAHQRRTGELKKRYCPKGHDKNAEGRDSHGRCLICKRVYVRAAVLKYRASEKGKQARQLYWSRPEVRARESERRRDPLHKAAYNRNRQSWRLSPMGQVKTARQELRRERKRIMNQMAELLGSLGNGN